MPADGGVLVSLYAFAPSSEVVGVAVPSPAFTRVIVMAGSVGATPLAELHIPEIFTELPYVIALAEAAMDRSAVHLETESCVMLVAAAEPATPPPSHCALVGVRPDAGGRIRQGEVSGAVRRRGRVGDGRERHAVR